VTGVIEKHQCEQSPRLRFVGGQRELAGQPYRLAGQVDPAGMSRGVNEVEHAQHDGEIARLVEPASLQTALCSAYPLGHRRLRHVEGLRNLAGREAADGAQGERHLRGGGEVRVAAAEQQEERVVALLADSCLRLRVRCLLAAQPRDLAAAGVDQPPGRHLG
jgi:hypothetical protein